jgi:Putative transposase of IS4/5 family (DUF4096)
MLIFGLSYVIALDTRGDAFSEQIWSSASRRAKWVTVCSRLLTLLATGGDRQSVFEKDRRVCVTHPPCDQLWAGGTTQPVPSDTSDEQWALIQPLLPEVKTGGRPEKHPRRALVDAILYVVRTGARCAC